MNSIQNKIDFAVVFAVNHANPNGDPLNGNRPRVTYSGQGEVSDVCLKRKLRDRLMELGEKVFVQPEASANDGFATLKARADATLKEGADKKSYAAQACDTWYDVRAFGQVFAFKKAKGKSKAKASVDAGEDADSVSGSIRGPVTVQSAFSVEPIEIADMQITKSVNNEDNNGKKSSDTMGMKFRVDHGIYYFFGSISPQLATRTGFSAEDAAVLKGILPKMFENDASSARPDGSMHVLKVLWWDHGCPNGRTSSARVHQSLSVHADGSIAVAPLEGGPQPEILDGF